MEIIFLARILSIIEYEFYSRYTIDENYIDRRSAELITEIGDLIDETTKSICKS